LLLDAEKERWRFVIAGRKKKSRPRENLGCFINIGNVV
jgi:hypothetical protein